VKTDFNLAEAAAKSSFVHFESFLYMLIFFRKTSRHVAWLRADFALMTYWTGRRG